MHVVLSVLLPIMITGLLFPQLRRQTYLRTGGLVITGVLAVLGVVGLRLIISATEDPGYRTPTGWMVAYVVAIVVLAWLALRVMPGVELSPVDRTDRRAPRPVVVGLVAGYLTMAFLTTMLPIGLAGELLFADTMSPTFRLIAAAMTAIPFGWLVVRWRVAGNWSNRHRVWLAGGILVSHTAFMMPAAPISMVVGSITIVVEVALLIVLARRTPTITEG